MSSPEDLLDAAKAMGTDSGFEHLKEILFDLPGTIDALQTEADRRAHQSVAECAIWFIPNYRRLGALAAR